MPCLRTAGTALPTSGTGGTTVVAGRVKSLRTEAAEETRTTLAPGKSVKGSATEMVHLWLNFYLKDKKKAIPRLYIYPKR